MTTDRKLAPVRSIQFTDTTHEIHVKSNIINKLLNLSHDYLYA